MYKRRACSSPLSSGIFTFLLLDPALILGGGGGDGGGGGRGRLRLGGRRGLNGGKHT